MTHVFYLAPTGRGVGLTSVSLGMVRALDRIGLRVGFFKPLAQPHTEGAAHERSTHFVRSTTPITPPDPIVFKHAEALVSAGRSGQLLEELVGRFEASAQGADGADVVVVEGLIGTRHDSFITSLNADIVNTLDAEVILVATPGAGSLHELSDRVEIAARSYGGTRNPKVLGGIVNKVGAPLDASGAIRAEVIAPQPGTPLDAKTILQGCPVFHDDFRLLGVVPWRPEFVSPRTLDVARALDAQVIREGELSSRRVVTIALCARTVANMLEVLRPDTLIITPGDRDDVIVAACMAALNGVPLAGLLLTSGLTPDVRIMTLCERAFATGLPLLAVPSDSYLTATLCAEMNPEVPIDDLARIERVMDEVASHLDGDWLKARSGVSHEPRLSPAAFRYQLVSRARAANKRIVLPEGSEPRTVQAAVISHERGVARCVLLAHPDEVKRVADTQGVSLPDGLEVIPPETVRGRYVAAMVALRKHKGMTEQIAERQLEDTVVLATMMLAQGEVDGLVSGAMHTTANTVRPAMQLIKTAQGAKLVSSVFFMCLPEQVLVFGDCAIVPDPDAQALADIAVQSAASAEAFGITPRVAMLSYSTGVSGAGLDVDKVREATRIARARRPDLSIDGPLQYDAATIPGVAQSKAPDSAVAGRATVLIFPDLNTGNTTYKAVQRSANVVSIGPMLQGLRKPVNDLSRGALVEDIVYTIALTAIQAEQTGQGQRLPSPP